MPRAEPRSGGPQAEHGKDPPVGAIRWRVQAAATREGAAARHGANSISFLMMLPHDFRPGRQLIDHPEQVRASLRAVCQVGVADAVPAVT
jgi:hypothetical protein